MKNKKTLTHKYSGGYKSQTQVGKNIAWYLPRPKPDRYKGGMPLYCEEWILDLAQDMIGGGGKLKLLNLFCGMNKYGFRVDIKKEVDPHLVADAHSFSSLIKKPDFNCVFADPPYSNQEAEEIYGTPKLNYKKWTAECDKVLSVGGLLIVYHKFVMPNPNPEKYFVEKRVFVGNRTHHLPRVAVFFRKKI